MYRRGAQRDLERNPSHPDDQRHTDDDEVLEEHAEREQDHAERGQRVQAGERWGKERACRAADHEEPKDYVAETLVEQEREAGSREAL